MKVGKKDGAALCGDAEELAFLWGMVQMPTATLLEYSRCLGVQLKGWMILVGQGQHGVPCILLYGQATGEGLSGV